MIPNFDWDLDKARENRRKHSVTFEEAATVFGDFDAVIDDDRSHSEEEDRFIIIGTSARERMLCTVYSIGDDGAIRLITSRRATRREKRIYEEKNRTV